VITHSNTAQTVRIFRTATAPVLRDLMTTLTVWGVHPAQVYMTRTGGLWTAYLI
jgi:hypothetical protein